MQDRSRKLPLFSLFFFLVAKSCLTLFETMVYSLLGSSVRGVSEARIWSGLLFPCPGDLPNLEIKPVSAHIAGGLFTS